MMNSKAQTISTFIILLVIIAVTGFAWLQASNEGIIYYSTPVNNSSFYGGLVNNGTLINLSQDLNRQFSGLNNSASSSSSLGDSFNQVYTLGVVTTRIVSIITPGMFGELFADLGNALGIPSFYVIMAVLTIVILLIGAFVATLLGRQF